MVGGCRAQVKGARGVVDVVGRQGALRRRGPVQRMGTKALHGFCWARLLMLTHNCNNHKRAVTHGHPC